MKGYQRGVYGIAGRGGGGKEGGGYFRKGIVVDYFIVACIMLELPDQGDVKEGTKKLINMSF
jgi:hypothetical protein